MSQSDLPELYKFCRVKEQTWNSYNSSGSDSNERIVVDYRPQKSDPNRVRITAGGNLIDYQGELTTRTPDLTTSKFLWNSVISTKDTRFMGIDTRNFYLGTAMKRFEYMKMPIKLFLHILSNNTSSTSTQKMVLCTLNYVRLSTGYPGRVF